MKSNIYILFSVNIHQWHEKVYNICHIYLNLHFLFQYKLLTFHISRKTFQNCRLWKQSKKIFKCKHTSMYSHIVSAYFNSCRKEKKNIGQYHRFKQKKVIICLWFVWMAIIYSFMSPFLQIRESFLNFTKLFTYQNLS